MGRENTACVLSDDKTGIPGLCRRGTGDQRFEELPAGTETRRRAWRIPSGAGGVCIGAEQRFAALHRIGCWAEQSGPLSDKPGRRGRNGTILAGLPGCSKEAGLRPEPSRCGNAERLADTA